MRNHRRFCTALAIAVALHLALGWLRTGGAGEQRRGAPARVLETRFVSAQAAAESAAALPATPPQPVEPRPPRDLERSAEPHPDREAAPRPAAGAGPGAPATRRSASVDATKAPQTVIDPAADYALARGLDPGPRPIGDIEPEYPESAHLQEGTVVLRLLISEAGVVDRVDVVRAEPQGLFEAAAIDAFGKAKFYPGLSFGTPVKSQITVEVHFLPINRGQISGRSY